MDIFIYIAYSCFHVTMAELNNCNRDPMAHKMKNTYYQAFTERVC